VGACAVGDQLQNTGSLWVRVAYSTAFGTLAFVNAVSVGALGGLTSLTFTNNSIIQQVTNTLIPDLAEWWRDPAGNIAMALDNSGMLLANRLQVFGQTALAGVSVNGALAVTGNLALTGNLSVTGTSGFSNLSNLSSLTFTNGDIEQVASPMMPDLSR